MSEGGGPPISPSPEQPVGELSSAALGRLARLFWEPAKVFDELAAKPTFVLVLLAQVLLVLAVQWVLVPRIDMEATIVANLGERARQIPPEQLEEHVRNAAKLQKVGVFIAPAGALAVLALLAGLYFLSLRVVGASCEFPPVFSAIAHASWPPSLVHSALLAWVAERLTTFSAQQIPKLVRSNLAAFLPDVASPVLRGIGSVLDVFNVWYWILLVLALVRVGRVRKGQAVGIVAVWWGLWSAVQVVAAYLRG